ncbi:MAG TPA: tetratricopeptide repeat protein [Terrimicrobiaceae bacterium]
MKRLVALLLLAFSSLAAQQDEIRSEAVRAFQAGDYATAKSLFESLLAIDPKNPAARNYLRAISLREGSGASLESALRNINIPAVDFRDVTVREAVAFVSQKVNELSGGKQPMNVVWMVPPERTDNTRVTLNLRNVPASEVLRYIGDASNLRFSYDAHAVKIRSAIGSSEGKSAE